jgi:protoporphyrinogen/coproporphyrinogen III oxidase
VKVAVVGGGVAGLSAALALLEGGAEPRVFEASARAGGKVATFEEAGFTMEDGPNALAAAAEQTFELAQELGLGGEVREAAGPRSRFVWKGGRLHKAPSAGLLSAAGWARALTEPLRARAEGPDDRSLQAYLVAHLGEEAGRLGAELMAKGVYAGDPALLSLREAFPSLGGIASHHRSLLLGALSGGSKPPAKSPAVAKPRPKGLWSLDRGLGSLTAAMAARLGDRLSLSAPVEALAPGSGGWSVGWGGSSSIFDAVVLALPAFAAADLCVAFSPSLAVALEAFSYAPVAVVQLGVTDGALRRPAAGFGLLDGDGTLSLLGTLFPASLFPGRAPAGHALLTSMVGGARRPELVERTDDELLELVRADLGQALGLAGPPVYTRVVRHRQAIPQVEIGHGDRVRAAEAALPPGLSLCGAAYHGVSLDAALRGGAAAARSLLAAGR